MMKRRFEESELILNADGAVYHLSCKPGDIAENIIVVGDPKRVSSVSKYFDTIDFTMENRELITHTGRLNGKRITALSTGMGPSNIDIVMNELDALFNIDLKERVVKENRTSLNIIRIGTSGSLQQDIPVDSFCMATHGLGIDGVLNFYDTPGGFIDDELTNAFIKHTSWPVALGKPYIVKGSDALADKIGSGFYSGITATAAGFFGPQGRELRIKLAHPQLNSLFESFNHKGMKISNFEMETSALYGLGGMMGHNMLTVCLIIANRIKREYSKDYKPLMDKLIQTILQRLTA